MSPGLEAAWKASLARMRSWQADRDPIPVYEALGWAVVLSLTGDLATRPARELLELESTGKRALKPRRYRAQLDDDDTTDDDTADRCYVRALATAGLSSIRGDRPLAKGDATRPSPRRVVRMLNGRMDGLSAAQCALGLMRRGGEGMEWMA